MSATTFSGGYGVPARQRRWVLAGVVAAHLVLIGLSLLVYRGIAERKAGEGGGAIATFETHAIASAAERKRVAGTANGADTPVLPAGDTGAAAAKGDPDSRDAEATDAQAAALSQALADALAENPASAGDLLDYRRRLLDHIRRFLRYPPEGLDARLAGTVTVRFRLQRNGDVLDLRVIATHGAILDAAAMDTIWKAEPLPPVPATIPVPWEVDVPIAFPKPPRHHV